MDLRCWWRLAEPRNGTIVIEERERRRCGESMVRNGGDVPLTSSTAHVFTSLHCLPLLPLFPIASSHPHRPPSMSLPASAATGGRTGPRIRGTGRRKGAGHSKAATARSPTPDDDALPAQAGSVTANGFLHGATLDSSFPVFHSRARRYGPQESGRSCGENHDWRRPW
jgi:hypothetical protein